MTGSKAKTTVLAVDDNEVNLMILVSLLKKHFSFDVLTATNGKEALDCANRFPLGAVFMDCDMPIMDGIEATRRIRQLSDPNKSDVPIMAITANGTPSNRQACLAAGMSEVLVKPLDIKKIKSFCSSLNRSNKASSA